MMRKHFIMIVLHVWSALTLAKLGLYVGPGIEIEVELGIASQCIGCDIDLIKRIFLAYEKLFPS